MVRFSKILSLALAAVTAASVFTPATVYADPSLAQDGSVVIDAAAFPDEAFRNWLLDAGNLDGAGSDGILTPDEMLRVTEIDVSGRGIGDLTGVAHFPSLTVLNCSKNNLTSLDVSQNTALRELYCSSNLLTQLDLSRNAALEHVSCASNRIAALHVTGCSQLISLNCESNRLAQLDLSGNPELIQLYSRHNQLTQLDVSNNTKLVFIETFDNRLTSFDCTMLKELEFLHIDYNDLTTLDMSQNPKLQGNGFVAANNRLETLVLPDIAGFSVEASFFFEQNPQTGYETAEWYHDPDYTRPILPTDVLQANGQTIYAKWIANPYTVHYHANGGRGEMPSQASEYGVTFHLLPVAFTRTGYVFRNWNTSSDAVGGRTFADGQEVTSIGGKSPNHSSVHLYAQWEPVSYLIRYDANGGSGSMPDTQADYDAPAALAPNGFTRTDFIFTGWSRESGDGARRDFGPEETVRNLTDTEGQVVTLYAVWKSHEELQQTYRQELTESFRTYGESDYFAEDWLHLKQAYETALSEITGAGADEGAMRRAVDAAQDAMRGVRGKKLRAEEIALGWQTAHGQILDRIGTPVAMESLDAVRSAHDAAVLAASSLDSLMSFSGLADEASRAEAALTAQSLLEPSLRHLSRMERAVSWMESIRSLCDADPASVTSSDAVRYRERMAEYGAMQPDEQSYCDASSVSRMQMRTRLAMEKLSAIRELEAYYEAIDPAGYTEENALKLAEIAAQGRAAIESAAACGMPAEQFAAYRAALDGVTPIVRTPVILEAPAASPITKGRPLLDSKLTGGKADAEGIFVWKDGTMTPAQSGSYAVVFVPSDATRYESVELSVQVAVIPLSEPAPQPENGPTPQSEPSQPEFPQPETALVPSSPAASGSPLQTPAAVPPEDGSPAAAEPDQGLFPQQENGGAPARMSAGGVLSAIVLGGTCGAALLTALLLRKKRK